jgi:hypothetical protein
MLNRYNNKWGRGTAMKEWVIRYWLQVGFGLLTAFVIACFKILSRKIGKKIDEQEAIKMGVQALLRDRIIQTYNHYMDRGYCPIYARENIDGLTKEYYNLHGNGIVHKLVDKLLELPTCKPHESYENKEDNCSVN